MLHVRDLAYGEQLVLWTARRWLANRLGWDRVAEEFALALGCTRARIALEAIEALLSSLHRHGRQTIYLHRLQSASVSGDEQILLGVLAALQAGETRRGGALLEYLLRPAEASATLRAAEALAGALAGAGYVLPWRSFAASVMACAAASDRQGAVLH